VHVDFAAIRFILLGKVIQSIILLYYFSHERRARDVTTPVSSETRNKKLIPTTHSMNQALNAAPSI